jgi:hypothetical protein
MTPTARTLNILRRDGYTAGVVERWLPRCNIRVDLFGCIDLLAIRPGEPVLAIQATSGSNHAARVAKSKAEPRLQTWLAAGGRFEIWSWSKRGERGKRKTWALRREEIAPTAPDSAPPAEEKCENPRESCGSSVPGRTK